MTHSLMSPTRSGLLSWGDCQLLFHSFVSHSPTHHVCFSMTLSVYLFLIACWRKNADRITPAGRRPQQVILFTVGEPPWSSHIPAVGDWVRDERKKGWRLSLPACLCVCVCAPLSRIPLDLTSTFNWLQGYCDRKSHDSCPPPDPLLRLIAF